LFPCYIELCNKEINGERFFPHLALDGEKRCKTKGKKYAYKIQILDDM
jgi:hypothetical protein